MRCFLGLGPGLFGSVLTPVDNRASFLCHSPHWLTPFHFFMFSFLYVSLQYIFHHPARSFLVISKGEKKDASNWLDILLEFTKRTRLRYPLAWKMEFVAYCGCIGRGFLGLAKEMKHGSLEASIYEVVPVYTSGLRDPPR
jgi:hypothetical protein